MSKDKVDINIKPFGFLDLLEFKKLIPNRKNRIAGASAEPINETPPVNVLASRLHPDCQYLSVSEIIENTDKAKTYKLIPDRNSGTFELAQFRSGQYLSFTFNIEDTVVTRPYSISSSPKDALNGFYEITVERTNGGYVSNYIFNNWQIGTEVKCSDPQGHFYYERLRDSKKVIGLAGGCGITPFKSIAKSIIDGTLDIEMTLLYGSNTVNDIIFHKELDDMAKESEGKFKIIHVLSEEKVKGYEDGFLTCNLIKRYADSKDTTIFICGPQVMYKFLHKELQDLNLRKKFLRWETFGEIKDINQVEEYPRDKTKENYEIIVHMGGNKQSITALAKESVLVAMERAGMNPPSICRSGSCGFCRSLLIKGDIYITDTDDGRRLADKEYGYIHPCSSFPLSDLEIIVPRAR